MSERRSTSAARQSTLASSCSCPRISGASATEHFSKEATRSIGRTTIFVANYISQHDQFPLTRPSRNKPLFGVRVIDAGNMVAAPFATSLLADFGADVIKIEHPKHGDGQRKLEPIKDGIPLWWKAIARNKRCITLDLSKPQGAAVFKDLTRNADVVAE